MKKSGLESLVECTFCDKKDRDHIYLKSTVSMCNKCEALVKAKVLIRDDKVYFRKSCPDCGITENLVSSDYRYYLNGYRYNKPGTIPLHFNKEPRLGCPNDCGLCTEHEQHMCQPVIDITDACNMDCPICLVECRGSYQYTEQDFRQTINNLIRCEGKLQVIILAGGEPTIHPRFFDFIKMAKATGRIERVGANTNGLKLAEDIEFVEKLKENEAYIFLQFDGWKEEAYLKIRGRNYLDKKLKAIENLEKYEIPFTIISTIVKGINDDEIGKILAYGLSKENILGFTFQPAAFVGSRGGSFPHDPMDFMTLPCVIKAIEEQSDGLLKKTDFHPVPCSHPTCFSLAYLLKHKDGSLTPFTRFMELEEFLDIIKNTGLVRVDDDRSEERLERLIYNVWSGEGNIPTADKILGSLKALLKRLFPPDMPLSEMQKVKIADFSAKTIFIHDFMDKYTYDLERAQKCCNHYPQPDERIMPMCNFNNFYRRFEGGKRTERIPVKI